MRSSRRASSSFPLHDAARDNDSNGIEYHLGSGIAINSKDKRKRTALHVAIKHGSLDAARTLIQHDRSIVNLRDGEGKTPLHRAAINDDLEAAKELLRSHADPSAKDKEGYTPFMHSSLTAAMSKATIERQYHNLFDGRKFPLSDDEEPKQHVRKAVREAVNRDVMEVILMEGLVKDPRASRRHDGDVEFHNLDAFNEEKNKDPREHYL